MLNVVNQVRQPADKGMPNITGLYIHSLIFNLALCDRDKHVLLQQTAHCVRPSLGSV